MPSGAMDEDGYLHLTTNTVRLESLEPCTAHSVEPIHHKAIDGSWWKIRQDLDVAKGQMLAVLRLIGYFAGYRPLMTPAHVANDVRAMIIKEHAQGLFHVCSYLNFPGSTREHMDRSKKWPERTFCVGVLNEKAPEVSGEAVPIMPQATRHFNRRYMRWLCSFVL